MDPAKYVIIKGLVGMEEPILIPCTVNHADIVKEHTVVISAGNVFFDVKDGRIESYCWGSSTTLEYLGKPHESRGEEDAKLINQLIIRQRK